VKDVAAGEIVTKTNVRAIRPGAGCSPSVLEEIVGKTFKSSYSKGTPLTLDKLAMN
jgi:N-acetylneuraminate synthase